MKKHTFNMVEILLALGVVAVGICSVMVLFPVGSNATRDSAMETYASTSAEQILNMVKYKLTAPDDSGVYRNWATYIGTDSSHGSLYKASEPTEPSGLDADLEFSSTANARWSNADELIGGQTLKGGIFRHSTHKNFYQIVIHRGDMESNLSEISPENVDFRAVASLWASEVVYKPENAGGTGGKLPLRNAARLNLRISWPAELPQSARQSAFYTLEVFMDK